MDKLRKFRGRVGDKVKKPWDWIRRESGSILLYLLAAFAILAGVYLWRFAGVGPDSAIQSMLLGGLLIVTAYYAHSTQQMAREMREQRQGAFLPIIDILEKLSEEGRRARVLAESRGEMPVSLECILKNVGVGPALHLQYQFRFVDGEIRTLTESAVAQGDHCGTTLAIAPPLNKGGLPYVQVHYRDVFGRKCTSTKAIHSDFGKRSLELGPLELNVAGVDYFARNNPWVVKP